MKLAGKRCHQPAVEVMEARQMLTATPAGPFTATVRKSVLKLMENTDLPQISIAVERGNDSYDYCLTSSREVLQSAVPDRSRDVHGGPAKPGHRAVDGQLRQRDYGHEQ